jgi:hypothetical protein
MLPGAAHDNTATYYSIDDSDIEPHPIVAPPITPAAIQQASELTQILRVLTESVDRHATELRQQWEMMIMIQEQMRQQSQVTSQALAN